MQEALAFLAAEQAVGRHAIVLEHQLAGVDGLVAALLQLLGHHEAIALLGDEHRHALVPRLRLRVGLDQQQHHVAVHGVGDPGLGAVDHVVVAFAPGHGADRLQVGAGVGLGQAQRAAQLAGGHARQVLALLFLGAAAFDRRGHDQVRVEDAGGRHPHRRHLDHDLGVDPRRQAQAAVLGGDGGAEQAQLLHFLDQLMRVLVFQIVLAGDRRDRLLDPCVDRVQQRLFFVRPPHLVHRGAHRRLLSS